MGMGRWQNTALAAQLCAPRCSEELPPGFDSPRLAALHSRTAVGTAFVFKSLAGEAQPAFWRAGSGVASRGQAADHISAGPGGVKKTGV